MCSACRIIACRRSSFVRSSSCRRLFVRVAVFDYGIVEMTVMLDGRLVWTAETQGTTN